MGGEGEVQAVRKSIVPAVKWKIKNVVYTPTLGARLTIPVCKMKRIVYNNIVKCSAQLSYTSRCKMAERNSGREKRIYFISENII